MSTLMEDVIKRWTAKRKTALVLDIIQDKTTISEASRAFDLNPSEVEQWVDEGKLRDHPILSIHSDSDYKTTPYIPSLHQTVAHRTTRPPHLQRHRFAFCQGRPTGAIEGTHPLLALG